MLQITGGAAFPACISHGFNKHPPLGVNATANVLVDMLMLMRFNKHPPLGVNATYIEQAFEYLRTRSVSTSTHPWG